MRAYVMESPGRGRLTELADPEIGDYDALVRMVVCGICSSTDRMLRRGTFANVAYPSILGHEAVGRIVELGRQVRHLRVGDLVTRPSAYRPDGSPINMHWGGMSELGVVTDSRSWGDDHPDLPAPPQSNSVSFDGSLDPEVIALSISLSETFSVIVRENLLRSNVGVVGTGIAGLSFIRYAKLLGAARVVAIGRRPERLALAERLGADAVASSLDDGPERAAAVTGGLDVVFESSGDASMIGRAHGWLRRGGRTLVYSAPETPSSIDLWSGPRDAALIVASTDETAVLPQVVGLTAAGVLERDLFVSHRYPFADIERAFADVDEHRDVVKAMLTFPTS